MKVSPRWVPDGAHGSTVDRFPHVPGPVPGYSLSRSTLKSNVTGVVIFLLCWMPLNMTHLMRDADSSLDKWYYFTLIFFLAHVVAMSSTIYNPFLYAWMNDNFKKEFRHVLPCLFLGRGSSQTSSSYTQYTNVETNQPSVVLNRSPVRNGGGGGNDCTVDMAPPNNSSAGAMMMKDVKACYDTDSEKVCLNVLNNTNSANHHHSTSHAYQQQQQPLVGKRPGSVDLDYTEAAGPQEQETAT
ncbi:short neuropeptide f receptor [Plakobranchus ocellatus]|uniref:Short neuropeptide f receptor n=1 Tax=Plakobranchus ocellatus TaxID=259542 RepID=A0AAV4BLJ2_9GAST|nr:short neuropeptide f receptor [Plakobranchus ocellatus]